MRRGAVIVSKQTGEDVITNGTKIIVINIIGVVTKFVMKTPERYLNI